MIHVIPSEPDTSRRRVPGPSKYLSVKSTYCYIPTNLSALGESRFCDLRSVIEVVVFTKDTGRGTLNHPKP